MKRINWKEYKFHCSQLGKIMTGSFGITEAQQSELDKLNEKLSKGKELNELQSKKYAELNDKKDNPQLSETTKSYLKELFIEKAFGRKKELSNKYIEKGNLQEQDNIYLLSVNDQVEYVKNEQFLWNDYICGTPDIITDDDIKDIKSSWDIFTFFNSYLNTNYKWQLIGYCILDSKQVAELVYVLGNTPDHLVQDELWYTKKRMGVIDEDIDPNWLKEEERINALCNYDDVPLSLRFRRFKVNYDNNDTSELYKRIDVCRNWLYDYQEQILAGI